MQFIGSRYIIGTPKLKELHAPLSQHIKLTWQPFQIKWGTHGLNHAFKLKRATNH